MLYLLPLPGPAAGVAQAGPDSPARPRQAGLEVCDLGLHLLRAGQRVLPLPPPPLPSLDLLASYGLDAGDPVPDWLLVAACDAWQAARALATVLPAEDCSDGTLRLQLSNGGGRLAGSAARLAATRDWPRLGLQPVPALPVSERSRDAGAVDHLRLEGAADNLHLFAHQDGLGLPASLRPRTQAARASKEGHALVAAPLRSGRTVLACRDWRGVDAGATGLDQLAWASHGRLLIHERSLLDLSAVIEVCERILGRLRVDVVRERRYTLREAGHYGGFCVLPLPGDQGATHICCAAHAVQHRPTRRLYEHWRSQGLVGEIASIDCSTSDPHGGPDRLVLPLPGTPLAGCREADLASYRTIIEADWPERLEMGQLTGTGCRQHLSSATEALRERVFASIGGGP